MTLYLEKKGKVCFVEVDIVRLQLVTYCKVMGGGLPEVRWQVLTFVTESSWCIFEVSACVHFVYSCVAHFSWG